MPDDERRLLTELTSIVEELLRGGAETAGRLRRRMEVERVGPAAVLAELVATIVERDDGPLLRALRETLRAEVGRWDLRADKDPAAARVRDLFAALLDVFAETPAAERTPQKPPRTPPRRSKRMP